MGNFSNIQKTEYINERIPVGIYVYKMSNTYLEKSPSFGNLKVEDDHFSGCSLGFPHFPDFLILSDLSRSIRF